MSQIRPRAVVASLDDASTAASGVSAHPVATGNADVTTAAADALPAAATPARLAPVATPPGAPASAPAAAQVAGTVAPSQAATDPVTAAPTGAVDSPASGTAAPAPVATVEKAGNRQATASFPIDMPQATTTSQVGMAAPMPASPATAGSIGGAVLALFLVIGLILALAWLARRMPGMAGASNPALRLVGSLSLGPRERVVVVALGETQLLLGVGTGGIRTLHTLSEPLAVEPATAAVGMPAFARVLAQHLGRKP